DVSRGVVLADERVLAPGAGLARQAAEGIPGQVDARGAHGNAAGVVLQCAAELAGPKFIAAGVVLAHERVLAAGAGLAGESAGGVSGHVHARGVHGDTVGLIVAGGAKLSRPYLVAVGVVLAHKCIVEPSVGLAWQGAGGVP